MIFSDLEQTLKPLSYLAQALTGFGLTAVLLAYLKHFAERRCWRKYKASVRDFFGKMPKSAIHPKELDEDAWRFVCERMLSDSDFAPLQVEQLLGTSVTVAKGIAWEICKELLDQPSDGGKRDD